MHVMFILIGFSLLVALFFLAAYFWASHSGQYDDTYTPSVRILHDNDNDGGLEETKDASTGNS